MKKKAIELTLNTVIIAALSLLVLIVLMIVFTGGFGDVINKIRGIGGTVNNQADCVAVGESSLDADHDGYLDKPYKATYKDKDGKTQTANCKCDFAPTDSAIHLDPTTGCS
jgi:hypothetical protein